MKVGAPNPLGPALARNTTPRCWRSCKRVRVRAWSSSPPVGPCTRKRRRALAGGRRIFLVDDENKQLDIETSRKVLSRALVRTVDAINALGIRVLLIGQPPEFFQDPNVCFVERSILGRDVSDCLRQPRQLVDQRLRASKEILQKVTSGRSATTYLSLDSILCDDQVCRTWEGDQPLYEDGNHLDLSGARVIGKALAEMPTLGLLFVTQGGSTHAALSHLVH